MNSFIPLVSWTIDLKRFLFSMVLECMKQFFLDGCLNCLIHDHISMMNLDLKKYLGDAQNTVNVQQVFGYWHYSCNML